MYALCTGIPILHVSYINACIRENSILDIKDFLLDGGIVRHQASIMPQLYVSQKYPRPIFFLKVFVYLFFSFIIFII